MNAVRSKRIRGGLLLATSLMLAPLAQAQVWDLRDQGLQTPFTPTGGTQFGRAMASGDLNADGYTDLAVGAPYWDASAAGDEGALSIYLGGPSGLQWYLSNNSLPGLMRGYSLAMGDFNNDGYDEVAFGEPGADAGAAQSAGRVWVRAYFPTLSEVILQQGGTLQGSPEPNDFFGQVLTVGDFNGDTYDDLVIGVPAEDAYSGVIHVIPGSATGLNTNADQMYEQSDFSASQAIAYFGAALAAGDFNEDDTYDDLAIGEPSRDISGTVDAGQVVVMRGTPTGLLSTNAQIFDQSDLALTNEVGDQFGAALAAGDFNRTSSCWNSFVCRTDLAIGIPGQDVDGNSNAGAIVVVNGSSAGLDLNDSRFFDQSDLLDGASTPEAGDFFGSTLASSWFTSSRLWANQATGTPDTLVIGAPDEDWIGDTNAGIVHLVFGGPNGVQSGPPGQFWINYPNLATGGDTDISLNRFGEAVAIGDFNADGHAELAVGIPGKEEDGILAAGAVEVLHGSLFSGSFDTVR